MTQRETTYGSRRTVEVETKQPKCSVRRRRSLEVVRTVPRDVCDIGARVSPRRGGELLRARFVRI